MNFGQITSSSYKKKTKIMLNLKKTYMNITNENYKLMNIKRKPHGGTLLRPVQQILT